MPPNSKGTQPSLDPPPKTRKRDVLDTNQILDGPCWRTPSNKAAAQVSPVEPVVKPLPRKIHKEGGLKPIKEATVEESSNPDVANRVLDGVSQSDCKELSFEEVNALIRQGDKIFGPITPPGDRQYVPEPINVSSDSDSDPSSLDFDADHVIGASKKGSKKGKRSSGGKEKSGGKKADVGVEIKGEVSFPMFDI